jgi:hypothetical protein
MFNLTESFKKEYETSLNERILKEDYVNSLKEFEDAQKYAEEGFDVINEYFSYFGKLNEEPTGAGRGTGESTQDKKDQKSVTDTISQVFNFISRGEDPRSEITDYEPAIGHVKMQSITDMRFPENIIFFFQQLISWIVNLVKKFISFFTNAVQRLFGLPEGPRFEDEIRLELQKSKKIESIAMPLSFSKDFGTKRNMPKAASVVSFPPEDYEKIRSIVSTFSESTQLAEADPRERVKSTLDLPGKKVNPEFNEGRQIIAIDINISKEMEGIQQLLQYFLDLFDNSYGSNREYLFGTEDLEMLLEIFRTTIKDMVSGNISTTAIAGKMTSLDLLSADKLKDNLIRTKINTDNLKKVYVQIEQSIANMLAVLQHKQLVAAENLGINFRFYSASTYTQMIKILDAIKPRIKQAEQMEKELKKMRDVFDKIVVQLGKQRQILLGVGQISYSSLQQKKIEELFNSARYVNQTISLRLATLGLFIRQIKEVREAVYSANAINSRNKDFLKKEFFSI